MRPFSALLKLPLKYAQIAVSNSLSSKSVRESYPRCLHLTRLPELVLSILIDAFEFNLTDGDIIWRNGHVIYPTVKGDDATRPSLPLNMRLVS